MTRRFGSLLHLQIAAQAGEVRRQVEPSSTMKLGLRLGSGEEDVGGLVGRALRTLAIIDDRPDHVAPNWAKGHVGLVDLRRESRAVAGDGEADHVRMDPLSAFLFARFLELPSPPAILVAA